MAYLKVLDVKNEQNKIICYFEVSEDLSQFFNMNYMEVEYSKEILIQEKSILIIPFLSNILPICWMTNSKIIIDEIDKGFYECIEEIRNAYKKVYSNDIFKGEICVENIIDNSLEHIEKRSVMFFSGGVDSFNTLINNIDKKPELITIWGADIKLENKSGWGKIISHTQSVSESFGLEYSYIKSNFREFINEVELNEIAKQVKDNWWHGIQHGIGIIGHIAPMAYSYSIEELIRASSYSEEQNIAFASHPLIDSSFKLSNMIVKYDGYEFNRQQKIDNISNFIKKNNNEIILRVCWKEDTGENCCVCEKCSRTITMLLANGDNPEKFGFKVNTEIYNKIIANMKNTHFMSRHDLGFWAALKVKIKDNEKNIFMNEYLLWIMQNDIEKVNFNFLKRVRLKLLSFKR